jgi:hypothetical protein
MSKSLVPDHARRVNPRLPVAKPDAQRAPGRLKQAAGCPLGVRLHHPSPRRGALCVPPGNDFAMTLRKGEIASENPLSVIQLGG